MRTFFGIPTLRTLPEDGPSNQIKTVGDITLEAYTIYLSRLCREMGGRIAMCPTTDQLEEYLLGRGDEAVIEEHVLVCASCQRSVTELDIEVASIRRAMRLDGRLAVERSLVVERRKELRRRESCRVKLRTDGGRLPCEATLHNWSSGGVCLIVPFPLRVNDRVAIEGRQMPLDGFVRYCRERDGVLLAGVTLSTSATF
jgi:hypothetical protein